MDREIIDRLLQETGLGDKMNRNLKNMKLSMIVDVLESGLEVMGKGQCSAPGGAIRATLEVINDTVKYLFNEELIIDENCTENAALEINISCMGESLITIKGHRIPTSSADKNTKREYVEKLKKELEELEKDLGI